MTTLPEALTDDLVEEFLLRLPPEDTASLVHASLVCKRWCRIIADCGFCRRVRENHHRMPGMPAMLGFFGLGYGPTKEANPLLFTPTPSFRPRSAGVTRDRFAVDARHGRVLLARTGLLEEPSTCCFAVWDPITGHVVELPRLPRRQTTDFTWKAVVLCASIPSPSSTNNCNHQDCHRGPFLVVFVGTSAQEVYAYVYSSQARAWSRTASAARDASDCSSLFYQNELCRSAVAGNAVYFRILDSTRILKYDLSVQEISSVDLPAEPAACQAWLRSPRPQILLTTTKYGGLGVAKVDVPWIFLWSRKAGPDGLFRWVLARVIKLNVSNHADNLPPFFVIDVVHSLGAIVIWAHDGVFGIDIESNRLIKLCDDNCASYSVPYMSFCTPALNAAFTGEGPSAGVSECNKKKRKRKRKRKRNRKKKLHS